MANEEINKEPPIAEIDYSKGSQFKPIIVVDPYIKLEILKCAIGYVGASSKDPVEIAKKFLEFIESKNV